MDDPQIARMIDNYGLKSLSLYLLARLKIESNHGYKPKALMDSLSEYASRRLIRCVLNDFGLFCLDIDGFVRASARTDARADRTDAHADAHASDPIVPNGTLNREKEKENICVYGESESLTPQTQAHTHTQTPTEAEVFCQQMMATFPRVSRMKKPLTYEEYRKLLKKHSVESIRQTLKEMENHPNLNRRYVSANLTIQNWLNFEQRRQKGMS